MLVNANPASYSGINPLNVSIILYYTCKVYRAVKQVGQKFLYHYFTFVRWGMPTRHSKSNGRQNVSFCLLIIIEDSNVANIVKMKFGTKIFQKIYGST